MRIVNFFNLMVGILCLTIPTPFNIFIGIINLFFAFNVLEYVFKIPKKDGSEKNEESKSDNFFDNFVES